MKLSKSPLILKDFFILSSQYRFVESKDEQVDAHALFESYNLEFDFIAREEPTGDVLIFVKIGINDVDSPLPGYSIFAEGVGIFTMEEGHGLNEREQSQLFYGSGLSIAINNLRNYLSNMTMYFPFGRYLLPTVDLNEIHDIKRAEMKEQQAEAKKKKKK